MPYSDLDLDMVRFQFRRSEPGVGPYGSQVPTFRTGTGPTILQVLPSSHLQEPAVHNFAKKFPILGA